jgi:hypothetical protein
MTISSVEMRIRLITKYREYISPSTLYTLYHKVSGGNFLYHVERMVCQEKFTVTIYEEWGTPTSEKLVCTCGITVTMYGMGGFSSVEMRIRLNYFGYGR